MANRGERLGRRYLSGASKRPPGVEREPNACGCGRNHGPIRPTRRRFLGATAAGVSASAFSGLAAAADREDTVTIVHDLHTHGETGEPGEPNVARYQSLVQSHLADRDDVIFVGTGDEVGPSLLSFFTEGAHKIEFMNEMALTAAGVGNHEFDYGLEAALERFEESSFPWLVANLQTPNGDPLPGTEPYLVEEVGGVRVGLFNVVLRDFHRITSYPEAYVHEDPVAVAAEVTRHLREAEAVDVVALASHVAHETHYELAESIDGLDVVFGSHSHVTFDEADVHHGTIISEIGYAYAHLGVLTIDREGRLVDWHRIDLDASVDPDPTFERRLEDRRAWLEERTSEPIGETRVALDASREASYVRESRLGNLITDVMLEAFPQADVAFQNAGGIRSEETYGPGTLTTGDILRVLPFGNTLVVLEATGRELETVLRNRIDALPASPFGALQNQQVGGLQYEWRGHGEPELLEVYVDGEALDPEATYRVATTNYVATSASGYEPFHDREVLVETSYQLGPRVARYVRERGVVEPALEGRILRVDEVVGEERELAVDGEVARVRFDVPETAAEVYPETFVALTNRGSMLEPLEVEVDDGVSLAFDRAALAALAAEPAPVSLRVFGGFEPDSEAYDYRDANGDRLELPIVVDQYVMKGTIADEGGELAVDVPDEPTERADSTPGPGPLATLAGLGAGAYAYRRLADDET